MIRVTARSRRSLRVVREWLAPFIAIAFAPGFSSGQDVSVLRDVTVIDGTGRAAQPHRDVVIEGGVIRSIGSASGPIPPHATVIEIAGTTIMPQMINAHGHPGLLEGPRRRGPLRRGEHPPSSAPVRGVRGRHRAGSGFGPGGDLPPPRAVPARPTARGQGLHRRDGLRRGRRPAADGDGPVSGEPPVTPEEARRQTRAVAEPARRDQDLGR